MIRIALQILLPLLAPTLIYLGWRAFARYRALKTGVTPHGFWESTPYFTLALVGLILTAISLGSIAILTSNPPGAEYQSPRINADGGIDPGRHSY